MTPTLRSPARSADSGIAYSPSSTFVSMLSNIFDISAINYDIIRNFQCNIAASLSFGRLTTILFSFMLICFLCAYYTKHLAFRPLQTPQLTGVVIHRPDEIAVHRAVLQQDRKNLCWNVPFLYVARKGAICRFASHLSFAFWAIVYQKNNLQTISQLPGVYPFFELWLCPFFVSKSKGDAALKHKKRGRVARAPLQSCFYQLFRLFLISKRRVKNGVAHAVSSCGVLKSSCGVSLSVMGRFAAGPGGRASSLPAMVWCHRTYGHLTLVAKDT